ncbi:MAG: HDIG domain-containing protein [Anaerolineales bacterium]|nr:HDIG domain-containing protein [Anaerolineales bacterium]
MDALDPSRRGWRDRLRQGWLAARLWVIFVAGVVGAVLALSLPLSPQQTAVPLEVSEVAPVDIPAPYTLSYTSEILSEQARQTAESAVLDQYDPPDVRTARQQLDRLRSLLSFVDSIRGDPFASPEQRLGDLSGLSDLRLNAAQATALLELPEARWQALKLEAVAVLEQVMRSEIREGRTEEARRSVAARVSIAFPEDQATLVADIVSAFIVPNALYNDAATRGARQLARQQVDPILQSFASGQTIIARGDIATPLLIEALDAYGLLQPPDPWREVAVRTLLVTTLAVTLALFGLRIQPREIQSARFAAILAGSLVFATIGMQAMVPGRTLLPYLFPAATLPMLVAVLFGPGMGTAVALVSAGLAGYLAPYGLEMAMYTLLGGVMGALIIGRAERLSTFIWAGFAAGLASAAMVIVFRFPDPATDAFGKASLLGAALVSGLLSASLGFGLVLLVGNVFGITTNLQLMELSRPDHPLLQFILRNAPGTYQHSLQVANLAEQAARAVGANAALVRVGALYHDAGKALRPAFFIENQPPGQNVHGQMDPQASASVIVGHVRDGLELARKYRLPRRIQAFIPEHHGTLDASFQYRNAVEAANGDASKVDRRDFSYPGPRPRSRETAILMLADGLEAKARAENPEDEQAIERLAAWVVDDRLAKSQLDRTDLTLRDLDTIRRSFASTLKGIYHPRIRYPQPDETDPPPPASPQPSAQSPTTPGTASRRR